MHVPTSPNGRTPSTPPTPGPFARQVAALRRALLATVTEEDMEAVARALVRQAREGNLAAAKLLLSYALGKLAVRFRMPAIDKGGSRS